jgi:uncharacterized protein YnzC (UPF0291/DUF896 family)
MDKVNLEHLTLEEKEKLKDYVNSLKEIKKEIKKMLFNKKKVDETGGNQSTGKILNIK